MPLFLRHRLLFIHIPKCAGDTVSNFFQEHGDTPFLFVADGSVMVNGHTPQHLTWKEFSKLGWSHNSNFKVAALVRHPIDRVISEFRYIHHSRPDLVEMAPTPSSFLDKFLSRDPKSNKIFDNHNLSILEFLENDQGQIDPIIDIRPVQEIDQLMHSLGLPSVPKSSQRNVTNKSDNSGQKFSFLSEDIDRIITFYDRDISWLNLRFPTIYSELIK